MVDKPEDDRWQTPFTVIIGGKTVWDPDAEEDDPRKTIKDFLDKKAPKDIND